MAKTGTKSADDKKPEAPDTHHKKSKGAKLRRQLISAAVAVVAIAALANGVPAPIPDNPISRMVGGVLTEVFNNRVADGIEHVAAMAGDALEKAKESHEAKLAAAATAGTKKTPQSLKA